MRNVKTSATIPELRVRRVVRRLGLQYTTTTEHLPGRPDVLLPKQKIAIFVHGCFWHGCPRCFVEPRRNREWWREKISTNRKRDRRKADQLRRSGFSVLTFWEHDDESRVRRRIATASGSADAD
jgi:DNA mismatch endonuclease (patch repair protein)